MKPFNQAKKYGRRVVLAIPATVLAFGMTAAQAAVDLTTEATAAKADVNTNGELIMGILFAVAIFSWLRRVIR